MYIERGEKKTHTEKKEQTKTDCVNICDDLYNCIYLARIGVRDFPRYGDNNNYAL